MYTLKQALIDNIQNQINGIIRCCENLELNYSYKKDNGQRFILFKINNSEYNILIDYNSTMLLYDDLKILDDMYAVLREEEEKLEDF